MKRLVHHRLFFKLKQSTSGTFFMFIYHINIHRVFDIDIRKKIKFSYKTQNKFFMKKFSLHFLFGVQIGTEEKS